MNQLSKLTIRIILVLLSSAYLMGCTGGAASSSFGSSANGTNGIGDAPPSSDGIVDPMHFFVGIDSTNNDIAHVRLDSAFGSSCSIDPKSSLQDLNCIIDIPEAELFMHGLNFIYNVPPGMCRYLSRDTFWFYNYEVGYGPSSVRVDQTVTDGVVTAATCSFNGGALGACNTNSEVFVNTSVSPPVLSCLYDLSLGGGVNGCLGDYTFILNTTTVTTGPPMTSTTSNSITNVNWGGLFANLIGGAGRWGWPTSSEGVPLRLYTPAHLGLLKNTYNIPAPVSSIDAATTMEIANYSTPAMNTHDGFVSATTSDLPYAIAPIDDISGSAIGSGSETYAFNCVDQAHEILHRVQVRVREWDTYQDYYDYAISKGAVEVPDRRVGSEGGNCTGIAGPCNDYWDFDDLVDAVVSYSTNLPGDIGRRPAYFPQIPRK